MTHYKIYIIYTLSLKRYNLNNCVSHISWACDREKVYLKEKKQRNLKNEDKSKSESIKNNKWIIYI